MSPLHAPAPERHEVTGAIASERRRTIAFLRSVDPGAFDIAATPGWRVREVVAHLITLDRAAVLGTVVPYTLGSGTGRLERWNGRVVRSWSDRPVPALLEGLEVWGRRFARLTRAIPSRLYRVTVPSAWGRTPIGLVLWIRAYDEWVHRHDIRRALGMPDEEVDLASVAEYLLNVITYDTLPKLAARSGRVSLSLEGAPILPWVYDLAAGRGAPGDAMTADARISVAAPTFIMAAAGRDSFDDLRAAGRLTVAGDARLGAAFLGCLRIV